MSLTMYEPADSRPRTKDNATLKYILEGTSDDVTARTLILSSTATSYDGLFRQSVDIDPETVDTISGTGRWLATVQYGPRPDSQNEPTIQFDTTGGTQHITQALHHIDHFACPGQTAEDFAGAIGVSGSGTSRTVNGVDIVVPAFAWSETHYFTDAEVQEHKAAWKTLTGRTNAAAWRNFAIGEVLFQGASGSKRGSDNWEVTFKFAASDNVADVCAGWPASVKPAAPVPKKGWETMDVYYREAEGSKDLIPKPVQIDINQVYKSGDYGTLGVD